MFILKLVLAMSVFLLISFVVSVLSRVNLLSRQIERIEDTIDHAEKRLAEIKK